MPAFDARSILDAIISGSSEQTRSARESGGLGDIMGDILGQLKEERGAGQSNRPERADPYEENQNYDEGQKAGRPRARNPLDDLFGQMTGEDRQNRRHPEPEYDDRAAPSKGDGYGDLLGRVKDLVGNNRTAAGAIIGGLGGLLLGTRTGRSLLGSAARLGGAALIGTLAYKAYKKHQQGASYQPDHEGDDRFGAPETPPSGSGFEEESMTNDDVALFIRTMVSAAASDGQIDGEEQKKILGHLEQAGMDEGAMEFLAGEFNNPASIEDIVENVRTREQATKVYTAARIAIEPDTREEQQFLSYLSQKLDLDTTLAAYIDAQASGIKVR